MTFNLEWATQLQRGRNTHDLARKRIAAVSAAVPILSVLQALDVRGLHVDLRAQIADGAGARDERQANLRNIVVEMRHVSDAALSARDGFKRNRDGSPGVRCAKSEDRRRLLPARREGRWRCVTVTQIEASLLHVRFFEVSARPRGG